VANDKGDLASAREQYEKALALATQLGAQIDIAGALINIGTVLQAENDSSKAIDSYQKARAVAMEIGDKSDLLVAENDLGTIFYGQGDFDAAADMYKRSLATARDTGNQGGVVEATINLGMIDYLSGALDVARVHLDAATAQAKALSMDSYEATSIAAVGDILEAQGKLREAEQQYRESLNICTKANLKPCVANAWLSLGSVALENDQRARAEQLAHEALREFESERNPDLEAAAHDLIAQSLLAEGNVSNAETEIDRAVALSPQDPSIALSLAVSSGRLLTQQRKFDDAAAKLRAAANHATSLKLTGWELQIRLRTAELQLQAGRTEDARAALQLLAKDASEKGYLLISRKAVAALDNIKQRTATAKK
jgi:tetratricopeptide (TPR) repeat protein